ncbi:hypothetical protein [Bacillus subtilis]|uniref:hypothetical protein n=1 Tax=Bacillus subtilis TaxID=1423 RepID=UPI001B8F7B7D|nr:hypothetical protein [Bacillus subtilis]CAF1802797.1 hypothetical protein NRS6141_00770 [Bacillus subtilis]CAF1877162.1 hypothetical protein NRS6204_00342 [Bacillus subtilis]CAF1879175.1 hypothetical protein NRS6205_00342 [Bacillus subtilis]
MAITDKINVLKKNYRRQLAANKLFEGIEEQLGSLRESITEVSKVSESSIQLDDQGHKELFITLGGKRGRIALNLETNEITAERLEPENNTDITYIIYDENQLSVYSKAYPSPQKVKDEKDTTPEAVLDTMLNHLFYDLI